MIFFFTLALVCLFNPYVILVVADGCKKAKPFTSLNETWFLEQGPKGWYICLTKDLPKAELVKIANANGTAKAEPAEPNSFCSFSSVGDARYKCSYKDVTESFCEVQSETSGIPKYFKSTIVLSDNVGYFVFMSCLPGDVDGWVVFCTENKALSEEEQVKIKKAVGAGKGEKAKDTTGVNGGVIKIEKECPMSGGSTVPDTPKPAGNVTPKPKVDDTSSDVAGDEGIGGIANPAGVDTLPVGDGLPAAPDAGSLPSLPGGADGGLPKSPVGDVGSIGK